MEKQNVPTVVRYFFFLKKKRELQPFNCHTFSLQKKNVVRGHISGWQLHVFFLFDGYKYALVGRDNDYVTLIQSLKSLNLSLKLQI
jgi:hypothetical protein